MLNQSRKDFINANFHENVAEQELSREAFEQLQTPQELDYLARQHNWDGGVKLLQWIAQSPLCSRATAAEIFWLSQPQEYQTTKLGQRLKDSDRQQTFALIQTLLQNYPSHYQSVAGLQFDPAPHLAQSLEIPAFISQPTSGEASYVYLDEDDVDGWFDSDWLAQIDGASTPIELFNIAWFLDEIEPAEAILRHPQCDKGIATLVYWRLHNRCSIYTATADLLRHIISDLKNGRYPELLAYAPKEDAKVNIPSRKVQWEIPPALKQTV